MHFRKYSEHSHRRETDESGDKYSKFYSRAETAFFWACGVALIVLALTSETLARALAAVGQ